MIPVLQENKSSACWKTLMHETRLSYTPRPCTWASSKLIRGKITTLTIWTWSLLHLPLYLFVKWSLIVFNDEIYVTPVKSQVFLFSVRRNFFLNLTSRWPPVRWFNHLQLNFLFLVIDVTTHLDGIDGVLLLEVWGINFLFIVI